MTDMNNDTNTNNPLTARTTSDGREFFSFPGGTTWWSGRGWSVQRNSGFGLSLAVFATAQEAANAVAALDAAEFAELSK